MIALFSALEPLRVANRFAGDIFSWRFASIDGNAVSASNSIPVSVSSGLDGIGMLPQALALSILVQQLQRFFSGHGFLQSPRFALFVNAPHSGERISPSGGRISRPTSEQTCEPGPEELYAAVRETL